MKATLTLAAPITRRSPRTPPRGATSRKRQSATYKVREHSLAKVPVLLVVGKREAADRTVSIRRLGSQEQTQMPLDAALKLLADEAMPPDMRRAE
jgi:threonyl-tRNA synthetase